MNDVTTEENTSQKTGDAKKASLFGKIVGGTEILLGSSLLLALSCLGKLPVTEAKELFYIVVGCGFSVAGVFGTVDINLMLEKFTRR